MKNELTKFFLAYLKYAAKIQLWKMAPKHIVGITGSAGKSSAREAVYAVLKEKFKVKAGKKSMNSEWGLPLDVLGLVDSYGDGDLKLYFLQVILVAPLKLLFDWQKYDVYVSEMGVDKPGDMDYLLSIVKPDIAVFLNALPVHTFNFPDGVEGIVREKGKILNGAKIKISYPDFGDVKPFLIEKKGFLFTEDYGNTFAAASAVGEALGLTLNECKENLEKNLVLPPSRMSVLEGINGSTIIDSSYNASPVTVTSALKALKKFKGKRKIAVLGDMRELGEIEGEQHRLVAKEALMDADMIFTLGPLTERFFPQNKKIRKFRKMGELIEAVKNELENGDVILVKGSQNTIMLETLVEKLLKNPKDVSKLCRRGEFWEGKRKMLFGV